VAPVVPIRSARALAVTRLRQADAAAAVAAQVVPAAQAADAAAAVLRDLPAVVVAAVRAVAVVAGGVAAQAVVADADRMAPRRSEIVPVVVADPSGRPA